MPASEAQILTNQANSLRSSGPKSESGRARSCMNATKHGMAGRSVEVEAAFSPEFEARRLKWAAEYHPVGEAGHFALDRVVAASFRIERCERAIDEIITDVQERARLAWDQDRAVEAATIAARLSKDPVLASRQLRTSWAGVVLLIEAWLGLVASLEEGDWSDVEASRALDLFGVDADFRSARTLIDAPEGADPVDFRRSLALEEVDRLEGLRDEAMAPLDDLDRRHAMAGASALLSKQAKLALRYEREAWKHYNDSMKELKAQSQAPTPIPIPPAPPIVTAPIRPPAVLPPARPIEEKPRAMSTRPAPIRREVADRPVAMTLGNDPAWLDHLDLTTQFPGSFVPISLGSKASGG
jgi:hypothetical protein